MNKVPTRSFWSKSFTKNWLANNTTFKYPKTLNAELKRYQTTLDSIVDLPNGLIVLKPNIGRQSHGVVLFEKFGNAITIFPETSSKSIEDGKQEINRLVRQRILTDKDLKYYGYWLYEEWIKPHDRFRQFTVDKKCPPILRFCGRPEIHFLAMSPVFEQETGLSAAGWQNRKYIWIDLEGVIRPLSDMNLTKTDSHSIEVAKEKSLESAPFGLKLEGIPEVIKQINSEIAPKISLYKKRSWSCDGIFNEQNEFVIIELNHSPGLQFVDFTWGNQ